MVLVIADLQPHLVPLLELKHGAPRVHLGAFVFVVVAESHHRRVILPALSSAHQTQAQVTCGHGVVHKVVEAGFHAGEGAAAGVVVVLCVGESLVKHHLTLRLRGQGTQH